MLRDDACTHFATGSFPKGVELVTSIGEAAGGASAQPDIDLRPEGVTGAARRREIESASSTGRCCINVRLVRRSSAPCDGEFVPKPPMRPDPESFSVCRHVLTMSAPLSRSDVVQTAPWTRPGTQESMGWPHSTRAVSAGRISGKAASRRPLFVAGAGFEPASSGL
jgi:hypothetical protein